MSLHIAGCLCASDAPVAAATPDERMYAGERGFDGPYRQRQALSLLSGWPRGATAAQAVLKFHYHLQPRLERKAHFFPVTATCHALGAMPASQVAART